MTAIRAERISKTYRVYESAADRLREILLRRPRHRDFHALHDVSFEVPRGGALGLIGENGAGKSTLLKIVAGTTRASSGSIELDGTVASILELGMGFHPEFSGRENARMNAALLGLSGAQIRRRLPEIRDFSELGDFFDRPVRTYSSGMLLRLAFSVATHCDAEVLIVDEALAVGDGYFQKKSVDRITEFQRRGGTLLFCSHALYYVALLCDRAIWLKNGEAAAQGDALTVVRAYETFLQEKERAMTPEQNPEAPAVPSDGRRPARIQEVVVHDGSGYARTEFASGETVAFDVAVETEDPRLQLQLRVGVDREDGLQVLAVDTREEPWAPLSGARGYRVRLTLPRMPIAQGDFRVYVYLGDEKALHVHDLKILQPGFSVVAQEYVVGLVKPEHAWSVRDPAAVPAVPLDRAAAKS